MKPTKNIWDDSECTISEEYTSPVSSKSPNPTLKFNN